MRVDHSDIILENIYREVSPLKFVVRALEPIFLSWLLFSLVLSYQYEPVCMTWKKASLSNVPILLMGFDAIKSLYPTPNVPGI